MHIAHWSSRRFTGPAPPTAAAFRYRHMAAGPMLPRSASSMAMLLRRLSPSARRHCELTALLLQPRGGACRVGWAAVSRQLATFSSGSHGHSHDDGQARSRHGTLEPLIAAGERSGSSSPSGSEGSGAVATPTPDVGAGHGHSHGATTRVPLHASPELRRAANMVIQVGMLTDLSLAVAKAVAGAWSGSSALISDAVHSTADILF